MVKYYLEGILSRAAVRSMLSIPTAKVRTYYLLLDLGWDEGGDRRTGPLMQMTREPAESMQVNPRL